MSTSPVYTLLTKHPKIQNHALKALIVRYFSSNLLGHSPMAEPTQINKNTPVNPGLAGPSWGVDANAAGGGVWANSSAKAEKLGELRRELKEQNLGESLDDAATAEERQTLFLCDGVMLVGRAVDECWFDEDKVVVDSQNAGFEVCERMNKVQFDRYMEYVKRVVAQKMMNHTKISPQQESLSKTLDKSLKKLVDYTESQIDDESNNDDSDKDVTLDILDTEFKECVKFYRFCLANSMADVLSDNWKRLTQITDADVDRAAVRGEEPGAKTSFDSSIVEEVVSSFLCGTCEDRVKALWKLVDYDQDGLLDEEEVTVVVDLCILPVEEAMRSFMKRAIEQFDVSSSNKQQQPPSFRQRRKAKAVKSRLDRMFTKTLKRHFEVQVETPHRLRCIYAWAEKKHQDGKLESVLVGDDDAGSSISSGKKRYVELNPKISLQEFLKEQKDHFSHLDRTSEELITSFREDLLVHQGKGRQNKQLFKESMGFITAVGMIDFGVYML